VIQGFNRQPDESSDGKHMSSEFRHKLIDMAAHFQSVSGVPCFSVDVSGRRLSLAEGVGSNDGCTGRDLGCHFCHQANINATADQCNGVATHRYGIDQAERFGGSFTYFCPANLVYWASPVSVDGNIIGALIAGSVLMIEPEDYLSQEVCFPNHLGDCELNALRDHFRSIPYVPPERVNSLSKVLAELALGLSKRLSENALWESRIESQQARISAHIHRLKADSESASGMKQQYPLAKERALFALIAQGDQENATQALHELLAYVLFASGRDLNLTRARVLELAVLMSRAALDGGANASDVLAQSGTFLVDINRISSVEELTAWLIMILGHFAAGLSTRQWSRNAELIHRAVQYLHANYHRKIDLQTVAQHLHIGAAHFSKLFKEEMGQSVAQYLNHIRVERSKELLRDRSLPLVEIADRAGFEDQSYFTKVFGRLTGMSPGRYRKNRGQREEANLEIHEREPRISGGATDVPPELTNMRMRQLDGVLNVVNRQPIGELLRRSA